MKLIRPAQLARFSTSVLRAKPQLEVDRPVLSELPLSNSLDYAFTTFDKLKNWARRSSFWPVTFGLACCRHHDCGRHRDKQDGAGTSPGVRPDAVPEVGDLDGQLCERRRLLPLQLQRGERRRPHSSCGRVRAGVSSVVGGSDVRHFPAAEEDHGPPDAPHVVPGVLGARDSGYLLGD
ncbi:hypothetical protein KL930_005054 [Ogataea haglerorum]|uniref:Uncharacterized protein n=1 Tax=Ogataea haglerorum TaxID=1937702 RepID=A0AAN6D111_9ASCO|nr:uncharacterized protein KL911_005039 [Ogataea haglerorum]KAG7692394.1 hypothetical protein KL951_004999 [Ogataea haglerorum]KAG7702598.1 hypothetical protein KL950_005143 [Ogataea haglerorum]KAG7713301.1 hypothetical protein KL913_005101 [Ogataea haglerorum]KAG7713672.1 hypothetical protein KL949_005139 [Ogataea haglerorum]KAG7724114.1 hypothetical protein KL933_005076 [Ogataea haglerorum]